MLFSIYGFGYTATLIFLLAILSLWISIFCFFCSLLVSDQWLCMSTTSERKTNTSKPSSPASVPSAKKSLSCSTTSAVEAAAPSSSHFTAQNVAMKTALVLIVAAESRLFDTFDKDHTAASGGWSIKSHSLWLPLLVTFRSWGFQTL